MLGLWIPETLSSPLADVVITSGVDLPSEPGAPAGQSGTSAGLSDAGGTSSVKAMSRHLVTFIEPPGEKSDSDCRSLSTCDGDWRGNGDEILPWPGAPSFASLRGEAPRIRLVTR